MKWLILPGCVAAGILIMAFGYDLGVSKYKKLAEAEKAVRLEKERKIEILTIDLETYQKGTQHYRELSDFYRLRGERLYVDLLSSLKNTNNALTLVRDYEGRLDRSLMQTERVLSAAKVCQKNLETSMRQTDEAIRVALAYREALK